MKQTVSIIIRTLNESKHLTELLKAIFAQQISNYCLEVVIVDSGSTDSTLDIARNFDCRITTISKDEFTFGRSLNVGCRFSRGDFLVFVSGHCIPASDEWLMKLVKPLAESESSYSYGRQLGRDTTKFSERMLFKKYFPAESRIPHEGYFCNNANAAVSRAAWEKYGFDESLTGLEDMFLAKQLVSDGHKVAYVADAPVYHIHDETWRGVRIRYEREALALRAILPELHFGFGDFLRCYCSGVAADVAAATRDHVLSKNLYEILCFRLMQYWGAYRGNHEHRRLSKEMKMRYFYPNVTALEDKNAVSSTAPHESKQ
jgi:glycosyltransferase involved in cell wall biosynthesis